MDIFAVQAYFGVHVLAFFETLLQIQPPHLSTATSENPSSGAHNHTPYQPSQQHYPQNQRQPQHQERRSETVPAVAADNRFNPSSTRFPPSSLETIFSVPSGTKGWGSGGVGPRSVGPRGTPDHEITGDAKHNENDDRETNNNMKATGNDHREPFQDQGTQDQQDDSATNPGRGQYAHLHVSASFQGKTYGELARHLIDRGAIPLGLYRPAGTKGSSLPYAHLNPSPEEKLIAWPSRREEFGGGVGVSMRKGGMNVGAGGGAGGFGVRGGGWGAGGAGGSWGRRGANNGPIAFHPTLLPPMIVRGDEVFVLRSTSCPLSGEV